MYSGKNKTDPKRQIPKWIYNPKVPKRDYGDL